jgi:S-adenosyl methyltransferase
VITSRNYDCLLGGKDNFEIDREAGRRAAETNPAMYEGVRGNCAFLTRSVRCLALTHPGSDFHPERTDAVVARLNRMMPQRITFRTREQVRRFFEGLEWVEPGLVRAPEWRPDSAADAANPAEMWSGVARKP